MALAGRRGPIRKHVTQMAPAARANFLNADHSIARITNTPDMGFVIGRKETRPPRSRIEFRARSEERQAAKTAGVKGVLVIVEEHATESRFRAVLEQHALLVLVKANGDLRTLRLSWGPQVKVTHLDSSGGRSRCAQSEVRSAALRRAPTLERRHEYRRYAPTGLCLHENAGPPYGDGGRILARVALRGQQWRNQHRDPGRHPCGRGF